MGSIQEDASAEFGSSIIQNAWSCDTLEKAEAFLASPRQASSDGGDGYKIRMQNYVGGSFAGSPSSASSTTTTTASQYIEAINPKTGRAFGQVPITSADEVEQALRAATDAFGAWSTTPATVRSKHLQRVAGLIQEHRELFAVWESIDQGKTLERARVEVDRAVSNFKYVSAKYDPVPTYSSSYLRRIITGERETPCRLTKESTISQLFLNIYTTSTDRRPCGRWQ